MIQDGRLVRPVCTRDSLSPPWRRAWLQGASQRETRVAFPDEEGRMIGSPALMARGRNPRPRCRAWRQS